MKQLQLTATDSINVNASDKYEIKRGLRRFNSGKAANGLLPELFKYALDSESVLSKEGRMITIMWRTQLHK